MFVAIAILACLGVVALMAVPWALDQPEIAVPTDEPPRVWVLARPYDWMHDDDLRKWRHGRTEPARLRLHAHESSEQTLDEAEAQIGHWV